MKFAWVTSVFLTLPLLGCGGSGSGPSSTTVDTCTTFESDAFNCGTMLENTTRVAAETVAATKTSFDLLDTSIAAYCADLGNATLTAAQTQWAAAMASVQQLEVMQFDAIADARDNMYNWPLNDTCKVDLQIATDATADITEVSTGRRGLNAIEYILFEEAALQSCADIYEDDVAPWLADDSINHQQVRCNYAKLISADLITQATQLSTQVASLDLASQYDSLQQAANVISDALFYVDKKTKDAKLKAALPQSNDGEFSESVLESQFAHSSKEHIKNNLLGAKAILTANGDMGLVDYLTAAGQEEVGTDMIAALDASILNIDAITGDFNTAIASATDISACINTASTGEYAGDSDIESICALQFNIKAFTDLLKGKFTATLSFTIPAEADGDND
jgi:predicted lipoprotein